MQYFAISGQELDDMEHRQHTLGNVRDLEDTCTSDTSNNAPSGPDYILAFKRTARTSFELSLVCRKGL